MLMFRCPDAFVEQAMRRDWLLERFVCMSLTAIALAAATARTMADDLPSYMEPIAGRTASSPAETATKNVLALNTGMFDLYDAAAKIFQGNMLARHPVILALFSGAGGRFILYRPGQAPLERSEEHTSELQSHVNLV